MTDCERQALVRKYADGELTLDDLRRAGSQRVIQILSDLNELGKRPPVARDVGPNVDSRREGMARLAAVLRS